MVPVSPGPKSLPRPEGVLAAPAVEWTVLVGYFSRVSVCTSVFLCHLLGGEGRP